MAFNSYTRTEVRNDKYVITKVQEESTEHTLWPLEGDAIITAWGGNGRFRFILNDEQYETTFDKNICQTVMAGIAYYNYSKVRFRTLQPSDWKYNSQQKIYWQEA